MNACCWDADTAGSLSLKGLMGTISWAELLSALRPPAGTAPLRTLCLEESELTAEALHGCLPLPGVTQLRLASCTAVRGLGPKVPVSGEAAGALLRTVPHLRSLTLHHCLKGEFPEQLASMSGLSKVELSSNGLSSYSIPTGPWLAGEGAAMRAGAQHVRNCKCRHDAHCACARQRVPSPCPCS